MKKIIKTVLRELSIYDVVDIEDLEKLKSSEYQKYIIESIPNNCGCWDHCECPREKLAFKGLRPETDREYQARLKKEAFDQKTRTEQQEQQERALLTKLQEKYPDAKGPK